MTVAVGLDLSLTGTGVSDGERTWLVTSKGKADATLDERQIRLHHLTLVISGQVRDLNPDLVLVEGPSLGQGRQAGTHDRAGLWWMVVDLLTMLELRIVEVPPSVVKKYATGKGNAGKNLMVDATARRFPDVDTGGGDDNRCDALWLSAMGYDQLGQPIVSVPAAHREMLDRVAWPVAA